MEEMKANKKRYNTGSFTGFIISIGIGFLIYLVLDHINVASSWLDYNTIVVNAGYNPLYKFIWYIMNFTEAQFYAGLFVIIGVCLDWILNVNNVAYASGVLPAIILSQWF